MVHTYNQEQKLPHLGVSGSVVHTQAGQEMGSTPSGPISATNKNQLKRPLWRVREVLLTLSTTGPSVEAQSSTCGAPSSIVDATYHSTGRFVAVGCGSGRARLSAFLAKPQMHKSTYTLWLNEHRIKNLILGLVHAYITFSNAKKRL